MGLNATKGDEDVAYSLRWAGKWTTVGSAGGNSAEANGDGSIGFGEQTSVIADPNRSSRSIPYTNIASVAAARGAETGAEEQPSEEYFPRKFRIQITLHESGPLR